MNRAYLPVLLILMMASCKESAIRQNFSSADSLVIHFKDEQAGVVTKTVQTTEKKAISRLIDFIEAPESEHFKCGYDGKMFFYRDHKRIGEVDFMKGDDSCRHFSFLSEGRLMSTRMNNEARDFLNALEQGLPTYY